ncbi:alpha/beta hydrolase domain-containing protein [Propionibacteriaceae bacterium G1746]|uniref:alpha/beta hydrolase domain-containing protein n=1 Tax=Aestuariimicrobium sp. G57 TaxID=3418485 RepID=UPI003C18C89A
MKNPVTSRSLLKRGLVSVGVAALFATMLPTAALAQTAPDVTTDEMSAVPSVQLVPRTADSYPFNAADHARVPVDLAASGFVEQEFFLRGYANVYTKADGSLGIHRSEVPYTNRILVRRPAAPNKASGTVFVDIYNASNGYDIEDMWRRLATNILANGHTYIGVTSKPVNVDALHQFDPERYGALSWYDQPLTDACDYDFATSGAWGEVPCTETGLAWDILTQVGNAVRDPQAGRQILGGIDVKSMFLIGQSQSSMYLNTYVNNFHNPVTEANGGQHVYDGYLSAAGNWVERSIRDGEFQRETVSSTGAVAGPATPVDIDVPWVVVDSEADRHVFTKQALLPRELDDQTRVWQVPGTGHTFSWSSVVPHNNELVKAGRPPRVFPTQFTPYPMEPAMIAAGQALIDNHQKGKALPASKWFDRDAAGELVRDVNGNVTGGLRYGLMDLTLAEFKGFATPGDMNGVANPISAEQFRATWNNRSQYLAQQRAYDNKLRQAGYLTADGQALFAERANVVLDRIGIAPLSKVVFPEPTVDPVV